MNAYVPSSPLPAALEVRELFEGLLGRDVDAVIGSTMVDPIMNGGAVVGAYVDDMLRLRTLIVADLAFAAYAGAAIALIPANTARAAIEDERLTPNLYDNVAEILNVAASLFNPEGAPHVRLYEAYAPRETLPPDVSKWVMAFCRRLDMQLNISGYGVGGLSVLAL